MFLALATFLGDGCYNFIKVGIPGPGCPGIHARCVRGASLHALPCAGRLPPSTGAAHTQAEPLSNLAAVRQVTYVSITGITTQMKRQRAIKAGKEIQEDGAPPWCAWASRALQWPYRSRACAITQRRAGPCGASMPWRRPSSAIADAGAAAAERPRRITLSSGLGLFDALETEEERVVREKVFLSESFPWCAPPGSASGIAGVAIAD